MASPHRVFNGHSRVGGNLVLARVFWPFPGPTGRPRRPAEIYYRFQPFGR